MVLKFVGLCDSLYLRKYFVEMDVTEDRNDRYGGYGRTMKYLGIFGGAQGLSMLLGMVRNKFASFLLGASGLTVISLFNRTIQMFSDCTGLSLSFSAVRRMSDAYDNCDAATVVHCVKVVRSVALATGVTGMLLMLLFSPLIGEWIFEGSGYYVSRFALLSPVVLFTAVSGGELAILRGVKQLNKVALYTLSTAVISLLLSVPLYFLRGIGGVFPAIFLTAFMQMVLLLCFSVPLYPYRVNPLSVSLLKDGADMIKLGAGYIYASMMASFSMWLICSLLSDFGDGTTAGIFSAGYVMLTMFPGMLFAALDSDYYPRLSGVMAKNSVRDNIVNEQVEVQLLIQSPFLMALIIVLPIALPLLYDYEFMPAVPMTQIALLGMFMRTMTYPVSFLPLAKGETMVFVIQECIYNVLLVVCVTSGFVVRGFIGVGLALAMVHVVDFLIVCGIARVRYDFRLSGKVVGFFFMQMPLFLVVVSLSLLSGGGIIYWISGAFCVLLSAVISLFLFRRQEGLHRLFMKLFKRK